LDSLVSFLKVIASLKHEKVGNKVPLGEVMGGLEKVPRLLLTK